MITEVSAEGYKSFRKPTRINFGRLTVFLGKNNSGKTAMARLPLALLSGLASSAEPFPLRVRGIPYGSSPLELVTDELPHGEFTVGLKLAAGRSPLLDRHDLDIEARIRVQQSLELRPRAYVIDFINRSAGKHLSWNYADLDLPRYSRRPLDISSGLVPELAGAREREIATEIRESSKYVLNRMMLLTSVRRILDTVYENRQASPENDPSGADVPYMLNDNPMLLKDVSGWYRETFDSYGISVERESAAFRLLLSNRSGEGHNLARAGQGYQQVLAVATLIAAMRKDAPYDVLIVEEPELHLHPSAHPALADLLVSAIRENHRSQFVIETHSENLLLRLRRHIAEGRLQVEELSLLYFEETTGGTTVRRVDVNPDGSVLNWPRGVFAEDLSEVKAISRAART